MNHKRPRAGRVSGDAALDPFAGLPLTRPRPVGLIHVAAAGAGAIMLGLGLFGLITALVTGTTTPFTAPEPAFLGPLNTAALINLVHVGAGSLGLAGSRHIGTAQSFLGAGGLGYMAIAPLELFAMQSHPGATVIVQHELGHTATQLPDVAPLLHFALGASMVVARSAVTIIEPATG